MKFQFLDNFQVESKNIGRGAPVFIIAEAGVNHFGDLKKAKKLVDLAVDSGADAFKLQVFNTEKLVSRISQEWIDRLKPKELSRDEVKRIQSYCHKREIIFFATAHEEESFEYLDTLHVPLFKIGSGEVGNLEFLEAVAKKNKPIIISTGMYTMRDIQNALDVIWKAGNNQVVVLHCVTQYPTPPEDIHLRAMDLIREEFCLPVGYSDHTKGWIIPLAAVARGASVIEKHITIDRNVPNAQDWIVSCGPDDFPQFVNSVRLVEKALGKPEKFPNKAEIENRKWAGKSIVAKEPILSGTVITREHICTKRPGTGIQPGHIGNVIGKQAKKDIEQDALILWSDLK
jgi:N,N'-diacetyllegionaminate synthase